MKEFYKESDILKGALQRDFIMALWEKDVREYQYAALDYIGWSLKKLEKDDLLLMERLIATKPCLTGSKEFFIQKAIGWR